MGADETHFNQGNVDGCNSKKKQGWLWVAVTPLVAIFEIALSRGSEVAKNLLGEDFSGILNSDRYAAYNWVNLEQRQLCWAHLRREARRGKLPPADFTRIYQNLRSFWSFWGYRKEFSQTTRKIISTMAPGSRWNFESI
ncbi:MAG: transposase [Cyanobacteria bacterium J06632_19]